MFFSGKIPCYMKDNLCTINPITLVAQDTSVYSRWFALLTSITTDKKYDHKTQTKSTQIVLRGFSLFKSVSPLHWPSVLFVAKFKDV